MNNADIREAKRILEETKNILIIGHKSPDGDSIGSSLGLYNVLNQNHNVKVCMPDPHPSFLNWMKGSSEIVNFEDSPERVKEEFEKADLLFCLDFNSESRVGKIEDILRSFEGYKIMIDHHQNPDNFTNLSFSFPQACSTAQLIYEFLSALEYTNYLDKESGACLYCGIMTDTGSFKFPSTTATTHRIIADLLDLGVDHFKVHEEVFDKNTENKLRLRSHILTSSLQVMEEYETAIISVKESELNEYGYIKGDTEGLVNVALSLEVVNRAVFFMESDGLIKISFRSKGIENPVNTIASKYFDGGGHINAAGGRYLGSVESAIKKFVTVLPEFV